MELQVNRDVPNIETMQSSQPTHLGSALIKFTNNVQNKHVHKIIDSGSI